MVIFMNLPPFGTVNHVAGAPTTAGKTQFAASKSCIWRASLLAALFVMLPFMLRAESPAGPVLALSTTSVSFNNVALGSATASQTVTLTSSGTTPLTISGGYMTGAVVFSVSGSSLPLTLNPGQTKTLTVSFDPKVAGTKSGTVTLISNAAPGSAKIALSGTAVAAGLTLSANSVSFNNVTLGSATTTQTVTVTSSGTVPLTISAGTLSGAVVFGMSGMSFPVTLNPGQTATLTVSFDPKVAGTRSGTVTLTSNTAVRTATIALSGTTGTGTTTPGLQLSSGNLSFGDVALNTPATQEVTITSSGTAPLTLSAGQAQGTGFSISGISFPVTLNPGQTATLSVEFDPTAANPESGSVSLTTNTSAGTAMITLSGTGTAASNEINLNWSAPTDSSDPAVGYNICRAVGTSPTCLKVNSTLDTATSYTDTTVVSGTAYTYYVSSVDGMDNESAPSNPFTVVVP